MNAVQGIASVIAAYVLGSFPAGVLVGRLWGVDVRRSGSGRTGGTNVYRAAGLPAALLTGALDVAKGSLAVWATGYLTGRPECEILAGAAVIFGHIHSLFLRFRGGAGVGTALGALAAIYPLAAAALGVLLVVVIAATRYASVGSLVIATLMPALLFLLGLGGLVPRVYVWYGLLAWAIIVYAHRPNIRRLANGTERRISSSLRTKPSQAD